MTLAHQVLHLPAPLILSQEDLTTIHIPVALSDVFPDTWSPGESSWNSGGAFINIL